MNIVFLSGGSGKRLWPLSNDVRSKQFIKLFKNEEGVYESMLQRVFRQCLTVDPQAQIRLRLVNHKYHRFIINLVMKSIFLSNQIVVIHFLRLF